LKVSFVNPSPIAELNGRIKGASSWPPLGILYMATMLNKNKVESTILDQPAMGFSINETVEWVKHEDPDILGFSGLSMSGRTAALTSMEVKKWNPDITVVFGGLYASFNSERILSKYPSVDIVVRGEGEHVVLEIVDALRSGGNLKEIKGITFRDDTKFVSTADRTLIEDLDSLPFPDRSLLHCEYHSEIAGATIAPKKFTSIISSRGCVYNCTFCSCTKVYGGRWRARSVDNTLEELHCLSSEGYEQFIFIDDCFTLNRKRSIEICRRMRKENLHFEWICEGRVDSSSYETYKELSKAGCRILYLGIESANQRILDYYDKRITPEQSVEAVKVARNAGIDIIMGTFILGAPDETREEIQNTLDFSKKLDIEIPQFNVLGVFPGQDIWDELVAKGIVDVGTYWETGVGVSKICSTAVPFIEIVEMIKDAVKKFVLRPNFLIRQIGRTLSSSYRRNIVRRNIGNIGEILRINKNPMG
jgi:radical SAM superfamily enzyme YgiQ (UPF0313 family)